MELKDQLKIKASMTISSRAYLSISHILTAAFFAGQAAELENKFSFKTAGPILKQHRGYVISTILLSSAFLEATINELFADCEEKNKLPDKRANDLMGRFWKRGIPRTARYNILEKYDIALEIRGVPTFDQGEKLYANTKLLNNLRNKLIHYEPETIVVDATPVTDPKKVHKVEKSFKGKFSLNPLTGPGNAFYPDKLLGAGCAIWSVKSALAFADAFFLKIGIKATYDHVRSELIL